MELVGSILAIAAFAILVVSIPTCVYFTLRLSGHRRTDLRSSWHDFWGLNRANLLFFPSLLTETGKRFQRRGMQAAAWIAVGTTLAVMSFVLLEIPMT